MKKVFLVLLAISLATISSAQGDSISMVIKRLYDSNQKTLQDLKVLESKIKNRGNGSVNSNVMNSSLESFDFDKLSEEISLIKNEIEKNNDWMTNEFHRELNSLHATVEVVKSLSEDIRVNCAKSYNVSYQNFGHGDYSLDYEGIFISGVYNSNFEVPSPVLFNHLGSSRTSSLKVGYAFGKESKFYGSNWWSTKGFKGKTSSYVERHFTGEYQFSLRGDYEWNFAHDFLGFGGILDGGVYSPSVDSIASPYLYASAHASAFCLYGSVGMIYSDFISYKSLYKFMNDFIPVYEMGLKTPDIKFKKFLFGVKATYVNYGFYNPKFYMYDDQGQIIEDVSKKVDKDLFKSSIYVSDKYGNNLHLGVSTWDMESFQFGISTNIMVSNIGKYFKN